jgi:hypothetical protein
VLLSAVRQVDFMLSLGLRATGGAVDAIFAKCVIPQGKYTDLGSGIL